MSATELGVTTMSVRSGRLLSTLFLVGIPLFVAFCNPPSAFAGELQWMEIRSPHFSVVTDAGEKRGREVAMRFEQMRAVFGGSDVQGKLEPLRPKGRRFSGYA